MSKDKIKEIDKILCREDLPIELRKALQKKKEILINDKEVQK
jgi:hypothetical protein